MKALLFILFLFYSGFVEATPIDSELALSFSETNKWGVRCVEAPRLFTDGLTYWLDCEVKLQDRYLGKLENLYVAS